MTPRTSQRLSQVVDDEWVTFPGGQLEGRRPWALCPACRAALQRAASAGPIEIAHRSTRCFPCYRAELVRERALKSAGDLDTASAARFQFGLPFEPVNRPRLAMLKVERAAARQAASAGAGRFVDRRRQTQIAARHALRSIAAGFEVHPPTDPRARVLAAAAHAAELQFPESWLPFVLAR